MSLELPNPDVVFSKWLDQADNNLLSKRYKKFLTKSTSVSEAETVKSTESIFLP